MPTVTTTLTIERPLDVVFEFLADTRRWPQFEAGLESVDTDGPMAPGQRGVMHRVQGRRLFEFPYTVTNFAPNERFTIEGVGGGLAVTSQMRFTANGNGTKIDNEMQFTPKGLLRLLQPVISASIRKDEKRTWASLKALLETQEQEVTTNDGG